MWLGMGTLYAATLGQSPGVAQIYINIYIHSCIHIISTDLYYISIYPYKYLEQRQTNLFCEPWKIREIRPPWPSLPHWCGRCVWHPGGLVGHGWLVEWVVRKTPTKTGVHFIGEPTSYHNKPVDTTQLLLQLWQFWVQHGWTNQLWVPIRPLWFTMTDLCDPLLSSERSPPVSLRCHQTWRAGKPSI